MDIFESTEMKDREKMGAHGCDIKNYARYLRYKDEQTAYIYLAFAIGLFGGVVLGVI